MIEHLLNIGIGALAVYALLAGIYLVLGALVVRINRRMENKRIQNRMYRLCT